MTFLLKRALAFMPGSLLVALSNLDIEKDEEDKLELNPDGWIVSFDKRSQAVSYSGRPMASFASIECIEAKHSVTGKGYDWWTLSLLFRNGNNRFIGRSPDGADVSIAAAHVSTITGKPVRASEVTGWF